MHEPRVPCGVDYDRGRLFVAGGGTGTASCTTPRRRADSLATLTTNTFVNDVIVTRTAAWFTESNSAVLYKVPLGLDGTPGPTFETVRSSPGANAARLQRHRRDAERGTAAVIIVQSNPGKLFTVDPQTGVADEIELTGMSGNVVR